MGMRAGVIVRGCDGLHRRKGRSGLDRGPKAAIAVPLRGVAGDLRLVDVVDLLLVEEHLGVAAIDLLAHENVEQVGVHVAAQAHLAKYKGRTVGTFGEAATFSFYPGKNLGAFGDAGAIVTNNTPLAEKMARFARHGALGKHDHEVEGINSRLDGLQGAVLSIKLKHLPSWTRIRQAIVSAYDAELAGFSEVTRPLAAADRQHVYHLYVIRHEDRDGLVKHLKSRGVHAGIHYPVALPFLKAYAYLGHRPEDFPNAFHNQSRILSLPLFPEMSDAQRRHVVGSIAEFCALKR